MFFKIIILFLTFELYAGIEYSDIKHSIVEVDFSKFNGHTISASDNSISDWIGILPSIENSYNYNSNEYIWYDKFGDDKGDGDYTYPTNQVFVKWGNHTVDIRQFRITYDKTNLYILIQMQNDPGDFWPVAVIIGIDTGSPDFGQSVFPEGDGINHLTGCSAELRCTKVLCDYFIFASSTYKCKMWNANYKLIGDSTNTFDDGTNNNIIFHNSGAWRNWEFEIPLSILGGFTKLSNNKWHFIVGSAFEENNFFREIQPYQENLMEWYGKGGDPSWWNNFGPDPDIYDLIGAEQSFQEEDLKGYLSLFLPEKNEDKNNIENLNAGCLPNPYNPSEGDLIFYYYLQKPASVSIKIFTIDGTLVKELLNNKYKEANPQLYEEKWNGILDDGKIVKPGIYIYQIKIDNVIFQKALRVIK